MATQQSADPDVLRGALACLTASPGWLQEFGPLRAGDADTRRLAETLTAYLEERSSRRRSAQRLGVDENTIKHRVRAIEELRGRPADERIAETLVALRLARVVGRDERPGAR
jgi:DNA-binding PucR family transcriptional regulator